MAGTVSAMFIPVHDPDVALGFYRDALGLEVRADVASDGFRWVTVGAPGQDVDGSCSSRTAVAHRWKAMPSCRS
jgi:predicted enzyme related to lactoylglutathione lyase